jgi:protein involved in ribonucleotide reduction
MLIVYFSNVTRNTERFVEKIEAGKKYRIPLKPKDEPQIEINEPYILITPTYGDHEGRGMVPHQVRKFLNYKNNSQNIKGVISSGNRNFGSHYGVAGEIISHKFKIPHLHKFELAGETEDIVKVKNMISLLDNSIKEI